MDGVDVWDCDIEIDLSEVRVVRVESVRRVCEWPRVGDPHGHSWTECRRHRGSETDNLDPIILSRPRKKSIPPMPCSGVSRKCGFRMMSKGGTVGGRERESATGGGIAKTSMMSL